MVDDAVLPGLRARLAGRPGYDTVCLPVGELRALLAEYDKRAELERLRPEVLFALLRGMAGRASDLRREMDIVRRSLISSWTNDVHLLQARAERAEAEVAHARALPGPAPAVPYSVSINNGLLATLDRYLSVWEISQAGHGPWPDDPDGGELRIVMALRDILAKTRHGDVQALVRSQFEPPGPNAPRFSLPDLNDVFDDSETWPVLADHTAGGAGVQERVCALCSHVMTLDRCGSAGAQENGHDIDLCHTDDHDCYHRWTVYRERPTERKRPASPTKIGEQL